MENNQVDTFTFQKVSDAVRFFSTNNPPTAFISLNNTEFYFSFVIVSIVLLVKKLSTLLILSIASLRLREKNNTLQRISCKSTTFICRLLQQRKRKLDIKKSHIIRKIRELCDYTESLWQEYVLESRHNFEKSFYYSIDWPHNTVKD